MNKALKVRVMKVIKRIFCVCCPDTKELPSFVRCILTLTRPRGGGKVNKMSDLFKNAFWCIIERTIEGMCAALLHMLKYISGVQEVYDEAVAHNQYKLKFALDHFKTQEMCEKAVRMDSGSEQFRTLCGL